MSESILNELCVNWCMMKPLRRSRCCDCCNSLDDSVLEDVEREQQRDRDSRQQEAHTRQPSEQIYMKVQNNVSRGSEEEGDDQGHARYDSDNDVKEHA